VVVHHAKLFRNRPDIRFDGRVHEQVMDSINRLEGEVVFTSLFVVHAGADQTPEGNNNNGALKGSDRGAYGIGRKPPLPARPVNRGSGIDRPSAPAPWRAFPTEDRSSFALIGC